MPEDAREAPIRATSDRTPFDRVLFAPRDRRIAKWLALWFFLFYAAFTQGHFQSSDELSVYETTRAIYQSGTLAVPPHQGAYPGADGRRYSIFAVGQSVLALPFYGIGALLNEVLPAPVVRAVAGQKMRLGTDWGGTVEIFTTGLYAPFASALLVALFFLFERRLGVSLRNALLAAILLGTATYVATLSIYFLQHTTEAIAILGALLAFLHWRETGSLRALAWGNGLACSLFLIRVPATVAGLGLAGYLLHASIVRMRQPGFSVGRTALAIAGPAALVLVAYAAANHAKWGLWLLSPMLGQYSKMNNPIWVGVHGFLLSPGSSVFAYTPLLLMAPVFLRELARRHRAEALCAVAICVTFLFFCSAYELWTGLYSCPGPRYQFIWAPLLLLALGPWLDAHRGVAGRVAVAVLAVLGLGVQAILLTANWMLVIVRGGYLEYQPPKGFLYVWRDGPIAQSFARVRDGELGNWLWSLAHGWDGEPARPLASLATLAVLLVALAAVAWRLRNLVHESEPIPSFGEANSAVRL